MHFWKRAGKKCRQWFENQLKCWRQESSILTSSTSEADVVDTNQVSLTIKSPTMVKMIKSLFLNRYAQSVTLNGEKINDKAHEETGYGIWLGWIPRIFKISAKNFDYERFQPNLSELLKTTWEQFWMQQKWPVKSGRRKITDKKSNRQIIFGRI